MSITPLTVSGLKTQAKVLRTQFADKGTPVSHSQTLEMIAKQHGFRDWNTAVASFEAHLPPKFQLGQLVHGTYLGHAFSGRIKALRALGENARYALTVRFDAAVDVAQSAHFENLRKQVQVTVDARGRTAEKTSDGQPHMVLHPA